MIVLLLSAPLVSQTILPSRLPATDRRTQQPDFFSAGLRVSSDFDDNALYDNANRHSRTFTRMEPRLTFAFSQPRLKSKIDYRPGLSWNYGLSNAYLSHLLETNFDYRLTKRLRIGLRNSFVKTRDPFDRLRDSRLQQAGQIQDLESDSFIAPVARTTSGQAALELSYAAGPHRMVGASGSYFRVKYTALSGLGPQTAPELEDARAIGGRVFYSHHVTRSQWTGLEYNVQSLTSQVAQSNHLVQSLLYVHKLAFGPNSTLSILAGPERSTTIRSPFVFVDSPARMKSQRSNWGWAGVASYNRTVGPTNLLAVLSHRISEGGLLGPVRLSGGNLEIRQKFATRWTADLLLAYNRSRAVSIDRSTFSHASAGAGITRTLNESLSLEFRYWRIRQSTNSAQAAAFLADHNRLSMAVTYDLKNPLGR